MLIAPVIFVSITLFGGFLVSEVSFVISCWETIRVYLTIRTSTINRVIYCIIAYYCFSQSERDLGGYCDSCHLSFGTYLVKYLVLIRHLPYDRCVLINVLHFV